MKNIKILFCIGIPMFAVLACTEKDLDLSPSMELSKSYYQIDEQVEAALWAAYDPLQWNGNWGTTQITWGNVASDDTHAGGADANDQPTLHAADTYEVSPSDPGVNLGNLWKDYFEGIGRCNQIIGNVKPNANDKLKKQAIAEAKFLKAQYYFYLARMFGGLPLIKELPLPDIQVARSTQDETFTYIEQLLNEAISSGDMQQRTTNIDPANGRATLASAQAYLGKVYLYHNKFADAIPVLLAIANNNNYQLVSDFENLFRGNNDHLSESIFEVNFTSQAGTANFIRSEGSPELRLYGPRSNGVQINADYDFGWGYNQPTLDLVNTFKAQNDLIRLNASAISSDSLQQLYEIYSGTTTQIGWVNENSGYWDNKHIPSTSNTVGGDNIRFKNNRILIRLSDVYLMLAEAYYKTGDEANAKVYLNKVRARVKLADVTASGAALYEAIKLERRLELAHEGERYFDLVRWGDADAVLGSLGYATGTPGTKTKGLFPLPQIELNKSSGPNALVQNEGY